MTTVGGLTTTAEGEGLSGTAAFHGLDFGVDNVAAVRVIYSILHQGAERANVPICVGGAGCGRRAGLEDLDVRARRGRACFAVAQRDADGCFSVPRISLRGQLRGRTAVEIVDREGLGVLIDLETVVEDGGRRDATAFDYADGACDGSDVAGRPL